MDVDVWADKLAGYLQEHMDTEREALNSYAHVAEETRNERVRFLVNMVLDDEIRHHRLFQEMVNWIRAEQAGAKPAGMRPSARDENTEHLLELTDQLLELEREDQVELKELEELVTEVADTAWWSAIVESMRHDTRKHIMLLEAVKSQLVD